MDNKKFPFDEDKYVKEIIEYCIKCNTSGHYSNEKKKTHTMELIVQGLDNRGLHHCTMTALTYLDRFGAKGGYNRMDIMKAIHYCIFALYAYDNYGPEVKTQVDIIDTNENK